MKIKILNIVLLLLLVADLSFSFIQYYNTNLDGDMAAGIVPAPDVAPLLDRPFGIQVFTEDVPYPNPNRFFSHWLFYSYFNHVPQWLGQVTNPIDSVYLSCAIAKIVIHIGLLFLLALAVCGSIRKRFSGFLLAALLMTALFQANGYRSYMGIIDPSTTYSFFYALPCLLILLYFLPFIFKYMHGREIKYKWLVRLLWIPLAVVVSLSGPLNPGIALIIALLMLTSFIYKSFIKAKGGVFQRLIKSVKEIPADYYFGLIPIGVLSLYSLYIGQFGEIELRNPMPLGELYARLPEGLFKLLTGKPGFIILFAFLIINSLLIGLKYKSEEGKKILQIFAWLGVFALIYILLLPLGGYRSYRPLVLRYDTFIPVTIGLVYMLGRSSVFLIRASGKVMKYWYVPLLCLFMFIFTNADKAELKKNDEEKKCLVILEQSHDDPVRLPDNCLVVSWNKIDKPEDSEMIARLLYKWGITKEKKLFYQLSSTP